MERFAEIMSFLASVILIILGFTGVFLVFKLFFKVIFGGL